MKKTVFVFLCTWSIISCNQDKKVSATNASIEDSSAVKTAKPAMVNIDALTASPANFKLLLENEHVRVLEYTLEPGKKDEWHTHPAKSSYIVTGGKLKVYLENGDTILAEDKDGTAAWRDAVGKHYVENVGKTTVKIILTEIKSLEKSQ